MRYNGPPDSCRLYRIKDDSSPARFVAFLDRQDASFAVVGPILYYTHEQQ